MMDTNKSKTLADLKNSWGTEDRIFDPMDREFRFDMDAAASEDNAKCNIFLNKELDALNTDWFDFLSGYYLKPKGYAVWCNPPYGRGYIKKFMNKAAEQRHKNITTVMLVPATLDAKWLPISEISEIRIITGGRLSFIYPVNGKRVSGNTKGSMFVIFRPSNMPLVTRLIDRDELVRTWGS